MTAPSNALARRPIRVAFVTASLDAGGAERQMLLLAEGLPRDECTVDFICLKEAGTDAPRARAAGARVRVVGLRRRRQSGLPLPLYLAHLAWTVLRYLRMTAGRYDILDAWLFHPNALAAVTRPLTRPRSLIGGRRNLSDYKESFGRLERLAEVVVHRKTDVVVANSEAVRADVLRRERIQAAKIRVIRNGVPSAVSLTASERRAQRAAWGAGDDTVVIGCVANYKLRKGLELLVRTAARLVRTGGPDVRLVLVGEGPLRSELEQLRGDLGVEREVVLHGLEPDARRLYGAFDIAVHASESEGLPNAILEAAAAGLPIVATAAGGAVEIIAEGATGRLVPIGDEDALVEALAELRGDPVARRRLGDAARAGVEARFGVARMVGEFADLYREMSRRPRERSQGQSR